MKFAAVDLHVTFVINREEIRVHNASVDGHGPTDTVVQRRSSDITVGLEGTAVDYHGAGVAHIVAIGADQSALVRARVIDRHVSGVLQDPAGSGRFRNRMAVEVDGDCHIARHGQNHVFRNGKIRRELIGARLDPVQLLQPCNLDRLILRLNPRHSRQAKQKGEGHGKAAPPFHPFHVLFLPFHGRGKRRKVRDAKGMNRPNWTDPSPPVATGCHVRGRRPYSFASLPFSRFAKYSCVSSILLIFANCKLDYTKFPFSLPNRRTGWAFVSFASAPGCMIY